MTVLDDLEAAERLATPGPWQEFAESGDYWLEQSDGNYNGTGRTIMPIVKMRNAFPAILRALRAARPLNEIYTTTRPNYDPQRPTHSREPRALERDVPPVRPQARA